MDTCTKTIDIPKTLHSAERGGAGVRVIRERHHVRIAFPEKNSYAETVEVAGRGKDVDAAIEELAQTAQQLNGRETVAVGINNHIIYAMEEDTSMQVVRELSKKYNVHIQIPKTPRHRMYGQACARLVGTEPNLTACKNELCRFFAFIEKEKALRMRKEVKVAVGEPSDEEESFTSKLLSFERMMAASSAEKYFSEENQRKLKETEEGSHAWEPFFNDNDG